MIRALPLLLVLLLLLSGCPGDGDERAAPRPNVIVLVMDTARADRCSLNGYDRKTTPFLEELARSSTVFTDAWSPSPWTGPAHASLFTGLRPENHGYLSGIRSYLSEASVTLAELLSEAGYDTACLTNNVHISPAFGMAQGFREFQAGWRHSDQGRPPSIWTHQNAIEWVMERRQRAEPYFLFINDMEPHDPYTPPPEVAERFLPLNTPPDLITQCRGIAGPMLIEYNLGLRQISDGEWVILSGLYDAEIAFLDGEIRNLVRGLGGIEALDDTILVILSDHGENLSDHGLADHVFSVHRTLLHVPLLIRFPGKFGGGRRVSATVRTEDVFATILELCGLEAPGEIDGVSLTANLEGRTARAALGRMSFTSRIRDLEGMTGSPHDTDATSVYDGRHHLFVHGKKRVELYDVGADPAELVNLAEDSPEVVERLRKLLPVIP